jgi:hypothetical protein
MRKICMVGVFLGDERMPSYTKLQSKAYKGGEEEAQAYVRYVEESDDAANACRRMNANCYYYLIH